jgi:hypothetical protein
MIGYLPVVIIPVLAVLAIFLDFLSYVIYGRRYHAGIRHTAEMIIVLFVLGVLLLDLGMPNSCCGDTALFSPRHRLTIVFLILSCLAAFLYSSYRKRPAPPLLEVVVNCLLLVGLVLNILVGVHEKDRPGDWFELGEIAVGQMLGTHTIDWQNWFFGHIPIALMFILALAENHRLVLSRLPMAGAEGRGAAREADDNRLIRFCRDLLQLPAWQKLPIMLILCLPLLTILIAILLLFGQRPDSVIRAFTDTYKHGFSQLDYECAGVVCGGHFLCTVAAKGHPALVRPVRDGVRAGRRIRCNRQLLVSNAFEELLEQHTPWLHRPIRRLYNRVGNFVHRYYGVFGKIWVADIVYLLMKPLEWIFVVTLYLFDRNPENRIAQQYLRREDRAMISERK